MTDPENDVPAPDPTSDEEQARRHFEDDLRTRGEAARIQDGELPPGATHEEMDDGRLVRRRFSAV